MSAKSALCLLAIAISWTVPITIQAEDKPPAAKLDAPLPDGWPEPSAPGEISVKEYPAYRSAVAKSGMTMDRADNVLFWQLFAHIQANEIAMTAPVVNTYKKSNDGQQVEMEFLYRTTKQGEAGKGLGQVKVEDHPRQTFAALGVQGKMNAEVYQDSLKQLDAWLQKNPQWKQNGDPRRLGYHGPMTPQAKRLWEVQIPVKAVDPD
ncbi:SOUL heme-binding protein [Bremerella volcania]|uniref:SOUL heme-binding protein n=1 Tax=Bremerella volcania TaxID=2527984 RepID=A0A518C4Q4_9BACT|nr:heme-binding protein [Bremerella volcania]QDU74205.1 SOUL heme-binding protein [Bremerella volcania]